MFESCKSLRWRCTQTLVTRVRRQQWPLTWLLTRQSLPSARGATGHQEDALLHVKLSHAWVALHCQA